MDSKEFAKRRKQLARMIGKGGIAILPAARAKVRNRDVEFPDYVIGEGGKLHPLRRVTRRDSAPVS